MRKEHIYSKLICGALLLFGICVPVCAQTGHLSGVRVINDEIKKKGREIHVDFVLDVTDMHVKRQESVRLYPVVVAKEGDKSLDLPSVVLDGRVRDKVHRREKALNGFTKTDGAKTVLRRKNGESQQVEYSVVIPYEPWLGAARLVLREQTTGCAECDKGTEETPVKSTFLQLFQPKYTVAFVPPLKEAPWPSSTSMPNPSPPGRSSRTSRWGWTPNSQNCLLGRRNSISRSAATVTITRITSMMALCLWTSWASGCGPII